MILAIARVLDWASSLLSRAARRLRHRSTTTGPIPADLPPTWAMWLQANSRSYSDEWLNQPVRLIPWDSGEK